MLKAFGLANGKLQGTAEPNAQVLIYIDPDPQERSHLITRLAIDEHTLNSSLDPEELGRRVIRKISDELETEIDQALTNKDLLNMFKLEKSLVYYLDAINSNNKVIDRLKANSC